MSDRNDCTAQPPIDSCPNPQDSDPHRAAVLPRRSNFPLQVAFRETLLWRFSKPEVAPALRLVGDALFDVLNEAHEWGPEGRCRPQGLGRCELQAAAADLDHLVEYLEEVLAELEESEPCDEDDTESADHAALARATSAWAGRLSRVVVSMKEVLGTAPPQA